jgi:hypothetical protein
MDKNNGKNTFKFLATVIHFNRVNTPWSFMVLRCSRLARSGSYSAITEEAAMSHVCPVKWDCKSFTR